MRLHACLLSIALALAAGACSDDGATGRDAGRDGPRDSSDVGDLAASPDGPSADFSPTSCFEFSLDPNTPLAIDGTFSKTSRRWRRPHDEPPVCPATSLLPSKAASVPVVAYAFCNNDSKPHTFDFEMLSQQGPNGEAALDDPYLILYRGQGIPGDPLDCLAINDDIPGALKAVDSEITGVSVPAGGVITMVGTTVTFSPLDATGQGYYVLVATVNDP